MIPPCGVWQNRTQGQEISAPNMYWYIRVDQGQVQDQYPISISLSFTKNINVDTDPVELGLEETPTRWADTTRDGNTGGVSVCGWPEGCRLSKPLHALCTSAANSGNSETASLSPEPSCCSSRSSKRRSLASACHNPALCPESERDYRLEACACRAESKVTSDPITTVLSFLRLPMPLRSLLN